MRGLINKHLKIVFSYCSEINKISKDEVKSEIFQDEVKFILI